MKELQVFENREFGKLRSLEINNQVFFVAKDVAEILGYENAQKAIRDHVDDEDKKMGEQNGTPYIIDSLGRKQYPTFINESGLYSLILSSKLPSAKKFRRWVTSEVLPSIRRNGGYIACQEQLSESELLAKAVLVAQHTIEKKNKQLENAHKKIQADSGKVLFANCVESSNSSILVGELAKILKQNGIDIGQNRLFQWLRLNKYLIARRGTDFNMPTQTSMNMGLFEIKETSVSHTDGHISISKTPKVTGKGQIYFVNKFKELINKT